MASQTERRPDWAALLPRLTDKQRQAMDFLRRHLPESDLDCYPAELFLRFADHALALREAAPWCRALDREIFEHYVLFPRVNDEDLSFHRDLFYDALWPRVRPLPTVEEQALEVNRWCHEHASYQAQDERTASPLTVCRCGSGRCGEESAFLGSALRSVGLPARQVYAPRWSHCDDNHAWVEVLCGDVWRYLGACEPEPVPDRGWFDTAASRAMLVHSRLFGGGCSPLHGEILGTEGGVTWFNQTARYADTKTYTFRAFSGGKPAAGAKFCLQVLNGASFHTIAALTADGAGTAAARLGRGSLHVLAVWNGLTAEGECGEDGLDLHLGPAGTGDASWSDFDFRAPAAARSAPALDEGQKAARARTLRRGNALREARMAGYFRPGRPGWEDLRALTRGNWDEILAFLSGGDGARRERLVRTLSDKDLRDVKRSVLEDHFAHLPPRREGVPEELYWDHAACPRIALEPLTPWRGMLAGRLSDWTDSPAQLRFFLRELLEDAGEASYQNLYWTPDAALEAGACDQKSRDLLLIAALRTLGVPARLRPLDGAPEYWADEAFRPVLPEEAGVLRLTCPVGQTPRSGQDWSLSRRTADGWQTLSPADGWRDGALRLTLPAGQYRVITSVRLPSGDQLASHCEAELRAGEERTVPLRLRPWTPDDLLTSQELPVLPARTLDAAEIPDLFRMDSGPVLALWLEEGGEPTEHVLNELLERRQALDSLPIRVLFLLRGRDGLDQPTLARALGVLDRAEALLDDWAYDLEAVARRLGRDPDSPPLMVLCDGRGRAVYSDCGYRVGAVELLLRVAARLTA